MRFDSLVAETQCDVREKSAVVEAADGKVISRHFDGLGSVFSKRLEAQVLRSFMGLFEAVGRG